jgi:hypothetical protein
VSGSSVYEILEPTEANVELAYRVSLGYPHDDDRALLVLTERQYFSRPAGYCTHPEGWPCFTSCRPLDEEATP